MKIIVAIAKNEPKIEEWILYHLNQGFDYIYIYDNGDDSGFRQYESMYPVTIMSWPGVAQQMNAYNHALRNLSFDWAAFIDCDEYIVCPMGLDKFLEGRNEAIAMPWRIFGNKQSAGNLVTERFRHWDYDPNRHVKTIVKDSCGVTFTNPHYINNAKMETPAGNKHLGPFISAGENIDLIWINHYYYQDEEHWNNKIARGRADTGTKRKESWKDGDKFNTYEEIF